MHPAKAKALVLRAAIYVGLLVFVNHFACTLAYSLPQLPLHPAVRQWTNTYMTPFFHQGWRLFAPDVPQRYYSLEVRAWNGAIWSEFEVADDLQPVVDHMRVRSVSQKLMNYLGKDMQKGLYFVDGKAQYDRVIQQSAYHRLLYFAVRRYELLGHERPGRLQLRLRVRFTPDFRNGSRKDDLIYTFPAFDLNAREHVDGPE